MIRNLFICVEFIYVNIMKYNIFLVMTIKCDFCSIHIDSWHKELCEIFYVQSLNLKPLDLKRKISFYSPSLFIQKGGLNIVF